MFSSPQRRIAVLVTALHVLALLFFAYEKPHRVKQITSIAIRTVAEAPPVKAVLPKAKPASAKPVANKPVPNKAPAKPAPVVAAVPPVKKRPELKVPVKATKEIKAPQEEEKGNYGVFLIGYLQQALDLPEVGEVKMRLEISKFGKLIRCEVLQSASDENAAFLKNRLPELLFPCLNEFGIFEPTHEFIVTFRNAQTSH